VGRPPLPANVHLMQGNASKLPAGALGPDTAVAVRIPEPPGILSETARAEWERITPHLERLGLVSDIYLAILVAYCIAWGDLVWARSRIRELETHAEPALREAGFVASTPQGYKQISAYLVVARDAEARLLKYAGEFGLTPSARRSVTGGASGQGSLFPDSDPMAAYTQAGARVSG